MCKSISATSRLLETQPQPPCSHRHFATVAVCGSLPGSPAQRHTTATARARRQPVPLLPSCSTPSSSSSSSSSAAAAAAAAAVPSSSLFSSVSSHTLHSSINFFLDHGCSARAFATARSNAAGVPVVLLSGFLGAGKTTLLQHLLKADHGVRLGIIVNDLASVNVDARVVESAIAGTQSRSVELSNGCVCCSASDDLRLSIGELLRPSSSETGGSRNAPPEAIIVELSGVGEPIAVRDALDSRSSLAHVAKIVTLVDATTFAQDFVAEVPAAAAGQNGKEDGTERVSALLAEQLECADLVLLNKTDVANEEELAQAEAIIRSLNESVELVRTTYGVLPVERILPSLGPRTGSSNESIAATSQPGTTTEAAAAAAAAPAAATAVAASCNHDHGHGQGHGHGHAHSHSHSHGEAEGAGSPSSAQRRFGIKSFVYTADRPFNRWRFFAELQKWQNTWQRMGKVLALQEGESELMLAKDETSGSDDETPLCKVLRSKGLVWLDSQPKDALYWSHAGRCAKFSHCGRWTGESRSSKADAGAALFAASASASAASASAPAPGAVTQVPTAGWTAEALRQSRNELVFIGSNLDEQAVRSVLDSCLASEDELDVMVKHAG